MKNWERTTGQEIKDGADCKLWEFCTPLGGIYDLYLYRNCLVLVHRQDQEIVCVMQDGIMIYTHPVLRRGASLAVQFLQ